MAAIRRTAFVLVHWAGNGTAGKMSHLEDFSMGLGTARRSKMFAEHRISGPVEVVREPSSPHSLLLCPDSEA